MNDIQKQEDEKVKTIYGVVKETQEIIGDDSSKRILEYSYDEDGNNTKLIRYDWQGKLMTTVEYTYDACGNCISSLACYANGTLTNRTEYTYDENDNVIDMKTYKNDELEKMVTYEYKSFNISKEK